MSKVIQKLEKINDVVSDLQPLRPIDFYLAKSSDLIQYLDRNAFEASLQPRWLYNSVYAEIMARVADPKLWKLPVGEVNDRLILKLGNFLPQ